MGRTPDMQQPAGADFADVKVHGQGLKNHGKGLADHGQGLKDHGKGLNADAYAAGSSIHTAPSRQGAMPHEAAHVVQQKAGRR